MDVSAMFAGSGGIGLPTGTPATIGVAYASSKGGGNQQASTTVQDAAAVSGQAAATVAATTIVRWSAGIVLVSLVLLWLMGGLVFRSAKIG